jgi:hypothetical protein
LVAHHVPPLAAIDGSVRVGERRFHGIGQAVVAGANYVSDRKGDGGACMMHDKVRFLGIRSDTGCKATTIRIVDDKADDVRMLLVAKPLHVFERAVRIDHAIEVFELVAAGVGVVDCLGKSMAFARRRQSPLVQGQHCSRLWRHLAGATGTVAVRPDDIALRLVYAGLAAASRASRRAPPYLSEVDASNSQPWLGCRKAFVGGGDPTSTPSV